jgi:hypothetical protein
METLLNIALWVLTILGYVIYNLYSKNVKLEQMIINRDQTLRNLGDIINESDRVLNEVLTNNINLNLIFIYKETQKQNGSKN